MSQARMIGLTIFQFAFLFTMPMPKTAPIRICVELTGMPSFVARSMTILEASSALKPVVGKISASFEPMVVMTSLPKNQSPTTSEMPKVTIAMLGIGELSFIEPVFNTSSTAANGPTAFAMSFAPCENAKDEAVKI